jgi:hypothetical protein
LVDCDCEWVWYYGYGVLFLIRIEGREAIKDMTLKETLAKLKMIGLTYRTSNTGHPDYQRIFVVDKGGVSLGRITIFEGKYDHIKWYWREYGDVNRSDYYIQAWALLLQHNEVLTKEVWEKVLQEAKEMQQQDMENKRQWRKDNPPKVMANGKTGRRRALKEKNIRSFIQEILKVKRLY